MAALAVPTPSIANRRPLSNHGMPKPPRLASPHQRHRFESPSYGREPFPLTYASPTSPGPLSPPMSARSFGTMIDSEPSTPAYSPRMDYDWDRSTLVLLRPLSSSSSEPSSPSGTTWEMMSPVQIPQRNNMRSISRSQAAAVKPQPIQIQLEPAPVKRPKSSRKDKPFQHTRTGSHPERKHEPLHVSATKEKKREDKPTEAVTAPLNKLASKMKSMLRRKSATESQKEKKKKKTDYYEVDRMEDVHWTEM